MTGFSESNEAKHLLAPQADTVLLWLAMFRKMPSKGTFAFAVGYLATMPPEGLVDLIFTQADYAARV
ncbi:MAG: hypothetical protein JWN46_3851 [Acidimicrobiales bacterium]|nr:hypothetical protein [Acidimicrobiales bacterium]